MYHLLYKRACVRRVGTWLNNGCVSCGNCVNQRVNRQKEWVIPGTHDQTYAIRRRFSIAFRMKLSEWCVDAFFFCKRACVFQHVADLTQYKSGLAHVGFKGAFPKIFFECFVDICLMASDTVSQTAK